MRQLAIGSKLTREPPALACLTGPGRQLRSQVEAVAQSCPFAQAVARRGRDPIPHARTARRSATLLRHSWFPAAAPASVVAVLSPECAATIDADEGGLGAGRAGRAWGGSATTDRSSGATRRGLGTDMLDEVALEWSRRQSPTGMTLVATLPAA